MSVFLWVEKGFQPKGKKHGKEPEESRGRSFYGCLGGKKKRKRKEAQKKNGGAVEE